MSNDLTLILIQS